MAHGYITPTAVGEKNLFKTIGQLLDRFKEQGSENGPPPATGSNLAIVEKNGEAKVYKEPRGTDVKVQKQLDQGSGSLNVVGGVLSNLMNRNGSNNVSGGEQQSTPGTKKGGSFVNLNSKPINESTFFKSAVVDGVNPLTGEYYSPEERVATFKKYRPAERTTQGASGSSGGSGADIVAALSRNTAAVMRMENAVREQTDNDTALAIQEINTSESMFRKSLAAQKEARMEAGGDFSGNITPEAVGARKGGGFGGSGGILGGLGKIIGGLGALKMIGRRGLGRMGTRAAAKFGGKGFAKASKGLLKGAGKGIGKGLLKGAGKGLLKGGLKMGIKKIPLLGLVAGGIFAAQRAMSGDLTGAALELASGAASTLPGAGTAASLGIDAALMARDATMPQMSGGGVTTGPKSGYPAIMHGTELTLSGEAGGKTKDIGEKLGEGQFLAYRRNKKDYVKYQVEGMDEFYGKKTYWGSFFENIGTGIGNAFTKFKETLSELFNNVTTFLGNTLYNIFSKVPLLKRFITKPSDVTEETTKTENDTTAKEGESLNLSNDDYKWLSYAVSGEAGPGDDRFAVAASILNRAARGDYGGDLEKIIKAPGQYEAYEKGMMSFSPEIQELLSSPEGQKKIIEKLRKLEGRTDFKGQSELGNRVAAEDPMFNKLGNFFHYDYQTGPNSVRPEGYVMPNYEQFINSVPNSSGGLDLAKASAEVASGDRKNNGATNTIVMPSETNGSKSGSSGIAMTTNPAGGSEDQGLSIYAAHLTLASV